MLWEIAPRVHLVDPSELPPLSAVGAAWWSLLLDGDLWSPTASRRSSIWSLGLGLGIIVGIALGVMMAWSTTDRRSSSARWSKALYPMPKSALIPVMILWFGLGAGSKIASIALGCLLPVMHQRL